VNDRGASSPQTAGLQTERTALAWRRTALAMGVGALAALRIFPPIFGVWALIPAAVAVLIAGAVFVAAHRRYHRDRVAFLATEHARVPLSGGALPAITAAATLAFGLIAAVFLVVR
jgi:uncharacterized membrane protein YidH (DUF202 family)